MAPPQASSVLEVVSSSLYPVMDGLAKSTRRSCPVSGAAPVFPHSPSSHSPSCCLHLSPRTLGSASDSSVYTCPCQSHLQIAARMVFDGRTSDLIPVSPYSQNPSVILSARIRLYTLHAAFFPFLATFFDSWFSRMLYPGLASLFPFHTSPSILVSLQISTQITLL